MNQIRILHCNNDNKNMGGAYLVERKLEPYMQQYGYVFDYITMDEFIIRGNEETDPLPNSKTYSARLRNNKFIGHIKLPFYVWNVLKNHPYQIVHIDIDSAWKALLYAIPAKKTGSKVLVHSHASGIDGSHKGLKGILHRTCKKLLDANTDKYIGCSQWALEWLCPAERLVSSEVLINGIDTSEFYYEESLRNETRKELCVSDKFVICNVGRINANKNQDFLVDILKEVKKEDTSAVLLLVGPYYQADFDDLMRKVSNERLNESVKIIGETSEVNRYLNAADFFVLPSIFEGFSLASIEAQSTGLRCLLSTGAPPEARITQLARREDLALGAKVWARMIMKDKNNEQIRKSASLSAENTMEGMARHMAMIYKKLLATSESNNFRKD